MASSYISFEIPFLAALAASLLPSRRILFQLCFAGTSWFRFHFFVAFSFFVNHLFLQHAAFAFVPEIPMLSGELPLRFFPFSNSLSCFYFLFFYFFFI